MISQSNTSRLTLLRPRQIEIKYALIAAGLSSAMIAFSCTPPAIMLDQGVSDVMQAVVGWGAIGVVLFAFAANAAYFVNIPYTILMLVVAATYDSLSSRIGLGVATGLGAAAGAAGSYLAICRLAQSASLQHDVNNSRVSQLIHRYPQLAPAVVFLGAVTPLPDDPVYAYLAFTGYPLRRLALPLFIGKVLHALSLIMVLDLFAPDQLQVGVTSMFPLLILTLVFILYQLEKSRSRQVIELRTPALPCS